MFLFSFVFFLFPFFWLFPSLLVLFALIVRHKQESWVEILPSGGGILQQERLFSIIDSYLLPFFGCYHGFNILCYYLQLYKRERRNLLVRKSNWKVGFGWSFYREYGGGGGVRLDGAGAGHTIDCWALCSNFHVRTQLLLVSFDLCCHGGFATVDQTF
jgi:hypothetical protein